MRDRIKHIKLLVNNVYDFARAAWQILWFRYVALAIPVITAYDLTSSQFSPWPLPKVSEAIQWLLQIVEPLFSWWEWLIAFSFIWVTVIIEAHFQNQHRKLPQLAFTMLSVAGALFIALTVLWFTFVIPVMHGLHEEQTSLDELKKNTELSLDIMKQGMEDSIVNIKSKLATDLSETTITKFNTGSSIALMTYWGQENVKFIGLQGKIEAEYKILFEYRGKHMSSMYFDSGFMDGTVGSISTYLREISDMIVVDFRSGPDLQAIRSIDSFKYEPSYSSDRQAEILVVLSHIYTHDASIINSYAAQYASLTKTSQKDFRESVREKLKFGLN